MVHLAFLLFWAGQTLYYKIIDFQAIREARGLTAKTILYDKKTFGKRLTWQVEDSPCDLPAVSRTGAILLPYSHTVGSYEPSPP